MRIPILTFGAFASILTINSVMADTTVTSKQYVDTTRQATIPATGTNAATPGTTVVTYTGTAGTIGERRICDAFGIDLNLCDNDNLVQVDALSYFAPRLTANVVTTKNCVEWSSSSHSDENCLLWDLQDTPVNSYMCRTDADCGNSTGSSCGDHCVEGKCIHGVC